MNQMRQRIKPDELVIAANQNIKEKEYWMNRLSGDPVKTGFPYDFNRKTENRAMDTVTFSFSPGLYQRLTALSKDSDRKLNMILAAGLAALLYKYTAAADIILGTPIYQQNVEGSFINTVLVLRQTIEPSTTFKELLLNTRRTLFDAIEHRDFPIEILADQLNRPIIENNDFPLFDVAFLLENVHDKRYIDFINFNMIFSFLKSGDGIKSTVEYNTARYEKATVERISQHFTRLLEKLLFDVDLKLSEAGILSENEEQRILFEFNNTKKSIVRDKCFPQLFEEQVAKSPGKIAAVHGSLHITYGKLDEESNRLAHLLKETGIKPGVITALYMKRSIKILTAIIGIFKAGGAYLPMDIEYPAERIKSILENSNVNVIVTWEVHRGLLEEATKQTAGTKTILHLDSDTREDHILRDYPAHKPENTGTPGDLAYTIYTSGSTGTPKGVTIHQLGMINHLFAKINDLSITGEDIMAQTASVCFDISVWQFLSALVVGGCTHIIDKETVLEPLRFLRLLQQAEVTILESVPSLMTAFLQLVKNEEDNNLRHLRWMVPTGEALGVHLAREWFRVFPGIKLVNAYGPTEASDDITHYFLEEMPSEDRETIPVGKPVQNMHIYIVDTFSSLCPIGVKGEICTAGIGVGKGYLKDPEKTAKSFVPNPFIETIKDDDYKTMYKTGDLGRFREDGNIEIFGRIDYQVKIRGNRIELGEIESCMLNYEGINETVVLARNNDNESGDKYLCAYLTADGEVSETLLRDYMGKVLPNYMIPAYFVQLETFPLGPTGKIDRKALPEPELSADEKYVAPRNKREEKLVALWADVLEIEEDIIGIHSNFFELGGDSLTGTILVSKIHKALNVKIPFPEIFRNPEIILLSEYIERLEEEKYISIKPVEKKEYYPLSASQERLFILQQMDLNNTGYHMMQTIPLAGEVNTEKLENTFKALITRHESLRTSFDIIAGRPAQKIHPENLDFNIRRFDLETLRRAEPESIMGNKQTREFLEPFDLSMAPLIRVGIVTIKKDMNLLLIIIHHIISDAVSQQVLGEDFIKFYQGESLPPLKLQYKEFSQWQNSDAVKQSVNKQKDFWMKTFENEVPVLELPIDYPRPAVWSSEGSKVYFELGEDETRALNEIVLNKNTTLFLLLFTIYNILVYKITNQEDIVVGTPVLGRMHADLERIVGMFINTLALRNHPLNRKSFNRFLKEVHDRSIEAFENQEYQFENLVDALSVTRDPARNPLFDTMFVFQNEGEVEARDYQKDAEYYSALQPLLSGYEYQKAKFDLTVFAVEKKGKCLFSLEYSTRLFKEETARRFATYFENIVRSVIKRPGKKIFEIEIMPEQEKRQLLFDFNETGTDYPFHRTIHQLFENQAEKTPDHIAVYHQDRQVSYRELNLNAGLVAQKLGAGGIAADCPVGILAHRSIETLFGILGILKAGGAYVPIEPTFPAERIDFILEDSGAKILLTNKSENRNPEFETNSYVVLNLEHLDFENVSNFELRAADINPSSLAYIIYTSGTTGKPKGAMIEHRGAVNYISWAISQYVRGERVNFPMYTSISFDLTVTSIFTPLLSGNAMVIYGLHDGNDNEFLIEKIIHENKVDIVKLTPSHLKVIKETVKKGAAERIRRFIVGGEELDSRLAADIHEKFQGNIEIYNEYGPTETTVGCMIYKFSPEDTNGRSVSIGVPIANTRIYILDERQNPLPMGVPGEICIAGDGVARGYMKKETPVAKKFLESPFVKGEKLYRSGDLGKWSTHGTVTFLGRIDNQVKIRGYRVEPGEIERRLMEHDRVENAVVMTKDDPDSGKNLCAYIVSDTELNVLEIREFLAVGLPEYMLPSYFYRVDDIPLTSNGKVDGKKLTANEAGLDPGTEYIAPGTDLEKKIAEIWKDVLNVDNVGVMDNFFHMGGNSLKVILLYRRLQEELNLDISVVSLFDHATIGSFTSYLDEKEINEQKTREKEIERADDINKAKDRKKRQMAKRKRGVSRG